MPCYQRRDHVSVDFRERDEGTGGVGSMHDEFASGHQSVEVAKMSLMSGFLTDF